MLQAAPVVEAECTKSCCNRRFVRLAVEGASQVSLEVYGYCKKVERMEWEAVVADGSRSREIAVRKTRTAALAGRRTTDG